MKKIKNKNYKLFFVTSIFAIIFFVGVNYTRADMAAARAACGSEMAAQEACPKGSGTDQCIAVIDAATKCLNNYNATKGQSSAIGTLDENNTSIGTLPTNNTSIGTLPANNTSIGTLPGTLPINNTSVGEVTPNSCESGETCMAVDGEYSPDGYDCTLRGVCPGKEACCRRDAAATSAAVKTGAAANPGTAVNPTGTSYGTSYGTSFTPPLKFKTVEELLSNVLVSVQMIIGTLALVFIVIGAGFILSSAGTPEMVERGKKAITMAFVGLAIGVAAPSLLKELAKIIGWGQGAAIPALTLSQIALNVLNFLLGVAGVLTLIMLVIGGIMYLTSAGDEDRIDSGKKIFKNSLIGILIIFAAMVLVQQVAKFFVS